MGAKTGIEWTDATWNPVRGCSRVSAGCVHCYAETMAARFSDPGQPFHLFADRGKSGSKWTGKVELVESALELPLRWKKPRRIFVNSMSDLFHEALPIVAQERIFRVMLSAPQHSYQVLTKRADLMAERVPPIMNRIFGFHWRMPDFIWLGVSVEDQATADARIPLLLQTPAAVRFVSYEPALSAVDFQRILWPNKGGHRVDVLRRGYWNAEGYRAFGPSAELGAVRGSFTNHSDMAGIDWVIIGGESGPGARPFDIQWAWNTIAQCKAAGVACFVKQLSGRPYDSEAVTQSQDYWPISEEKYDAVRAFPGAAKEWALCHVLKDRKGGDMREWPEDLRVREFPERRSATP